VVVVKKPFINYGNNIRLSNVSLMHGMSDYLNYSSYYNHTFNLYIHIFIK